VCHFARWSDLLSPRHQSPIAVDFYDDLHMADDPAWMFSKADRIAREEDIGMEAVSLISRARGSRT